MMVFLTNKTNFVFTEQEQVGRMVLRTKMIFSVIRRISGSEWTHFIFFEQNSLKFADINTQRKKNRF